MMAGWRIYDTPFGRLVGYVRERYRGVRDQRRLCIVDPLGRVHHFDEDEVVERPYR